MVRAIVVGVVCVLVLIGAWCVQNQLSWLDTRVSIIESYLDLGE
jgi:hypothetical protein